MCKTFKHAELEVRERIILVENSWLRTEDQLNLLQRIAKLLDERHQSLQLETLQVLSSKLNTVITKLHSVLEPDTKRQDVDDTAFRVKRVKYLFVKETIDEAIKSLKLWQETFDPSWFLIMKAASPQIDKELEELNRETTDRPVLKSAVALRAAVNADQHDKTTILLPPGGLGSFNTATLAFSDVKYVKRPGVGNDLILDEIHRPSHVDPNTSRKSITTLARKLAKSNPTTFGLLTCKGVMVHEGERKGEVSGYTLVHRIPGDYKDPQSLRQRLLEQDAYSHSLSDRLQLAKDLMKGVSYVHTFGFVHKNIRPETIILFNSSNTPIGSIVLVGFEEFRTEDGKTYRTGDEEGEKNLYRHPRRQGSAPQEDYVMQHDIYSLGVCLLEVGLWQSILNFSTDNEEQAAMASVTETLLPSDSLSKEGLLAAKDHLVNLARIKLPPVVGNKYAEVVATCLTCLDEDNGDFGDEEELLDEDGVVVGVRFIHKASFVTLCACGTY